LLNFSLGHVTEKMLWS